jgi:heptosyltransferase-2/heptosyltransferase-3
MTLAPIRPHPIVIWFGRVGDMILLSALLGLLHERYGARCFVVGAGAWISEIYKRHQDVEQVWYLRRYTPFLVDAGWWRVFGALRRHRSEPIYICETDARKLKRIRWLLALSRTSPDRCVFMNEELLAAESRGQPLEHWVDRLLSLGQRTPPALSQTAFQVPAAGARAPRLDVSAEDRARTEEWLRAKGWYGRPLVLIQPGNRRTMRGKKLKRSAADDKAWPIETWAALLRRIHTALPNAVIVLVGAPKEALLLGWIEEAAALHSVATATLPLADLFALCAIAHSMISVDSGPAHAAAAVGLPLVVLFGAHSQREWLPRSAGSPVVGIGGPPVSRRLDQISDETVFEAWLALSEAQAELGSRVGMRT